MAPLHPLTTKCHLMLAELLSGLDARCQFSYSVQVIKEHEFQFDGIFTPVSDDLKIPMVFAEVQM
ncbi:MAG: Rpn family recombination-promoting nuclease/putative transposase [Cyanobacteria bacterium LVE1205-1]